MTKSLTLCFAVAVLQACSASSDITSMETLPAAAAQEAPNSSDSDSGTNAQISPPVAVPGSGNDTEADNSSSSGTDGSDSDNGDGLDASTNVDNSDTAAADNSSVVDIQLVANAGAVECAAPTAEFENTMLAVVNQSRGVARMCGDESYDAVGSVLWNNQLSQAAVNHANDMVTHNFFSHDGSDGLSVSHRADAVSYNWRAIGENIAAGQMDIEEVHQGWIDSPGHCRNIMNSLYTEVGAACVTTDSANYGSYWVVVFGDQL